MSGKVEWFRELVKQYTDGGLRTLLEETENAVKAPTLTPEEFNRGKAGKTGDLHWDFQLFKEVIKAELATRGQK